MEFEIGYSSSYGWYVYDKDNFSSYLRNDGTIHQSCGSGGFYDTRRDAQEQIIKYKSRTEDDVYLERCGM